ncbi:MAG: GEVED domain-containing protein [Granulosicoccus sp.]
MRSSNLLAVVLPCMLMAPVACVFAADTGDAPSSYGAASHELTGGGPWLGMVKPDDNTPFAGLEADGDDTDAGGDDEDGTFSQASFIAKGKTYDTDVLVNNPGNVSATLIGWIDFDGNQVFDVTEAELVAIPAGAVDTLVNLRWTGPENQFDGFVGQTYARFRITTATISKNDPATSVDDGEVEDYAVLILFDGDGDGIPDVDDPDDDGDGIPDTVEGPGVDTDQDGQPDTLDSDSDNDGIPDFIEAGDVPQTPADSDQDNVPDYLDLDSDNDGAPDSEQVTGDADGDGLSGGLEGFLDTDGDGILDADDLDSDNDTIPDSVEGFNGSESPVDTDLDGVMDFLDLDSDNDGLPDIREAGTLDAATWDTDNDGQVDAGSVFGENGMLDSAESPVESGIAVTAIIDTDADGLADFRDLDSDADGVFDIVEAGGADTDANGVVDTLIDSDNDGISDDIDADFIGIDNNRDGIDDDAEASPADSRPDTDKDGIVDSRDNDVDGDGIVDTGGFVLSDGADFPDSDGDGIADFQDQDTLGGDGTTGAAVDTGNGNEPIKTGRSGYGGCSIVGGSRHDPMFPLLLLILSLAGWKRRTWRH